MSDYMAKTIVKIAKIIVNADILNYFRIELYPGPFALIHHHL